MKVLITGCSGQVGLCVVSMLKQREDIELFAYSRDELDITSQGAVMQLVAGVIPDVIINAAAYTAVDKAEVEIERCYFVNRDGPKFLAQAAESVGALLLHISTDYVFDGEKAGLYVETDQPQPKSVYGKSKLAGELAVQEFCSRYIILRTSWVFSQYGENFVKTMLRLGQEYSELSVVGDQVGAPTFAGDIAKALVIIMDQLINSKNSSKLGIYHFSGTPYVTWYEFAKRIFESAQVSGTINPTPELKEINTEQYPTRAPRPKNSSLDCNRIKLDFDIKPSDWKSELLNINSYR